MTSATVTSKGQVTPLNVPALALSGILHRPGMRAATIEEMEEAIAEGANVSHE